VPADRDAPRGVSHDGADSAFVVEERVPTVAELLRLYRAVGWTETLPDDKAALQRGLDNTLFGVCAVHEGETIACARVVGDGGIYFYLEDVAVLPAYQRRGAGHLLLRAVCAFLDRSAAPRAAVRLLTGPRHRAFYEEFGFRHGPEEPVMWRDAP